MSQAANVIAIHTKTSGRVKILKEPKPVEVEIAEVVPICINDDNIDDFKFGGEPDVNFDDELVNETMKEFNVDTEEELGDILTVESVMKS